MAILPRSITNGRKCFYNAPVVVWLLLTIVWMPVAGAVPASAAINAEVVAIPQELGTITGRGGGDDGQPFIFVIGEEHISLKVQQAVAGILRYLSGAYDVKLVCTEGFNKPLVIQPGGIPLAAQRYIASADLMGRRISGVEFFARAHPEVSVIGVEDMGAYRDHGIQLDKLSGLNKEAKQWEKDFRKFLIDDMGNLKVNAGDAQRLEAAVKRLLKTKDFGTFINSVTEIVGSQSAIGKKLTALNERREALEKSARSATGDSPEMQRRDRAMVTATLRSMREKNANRAALVVGKLHLAGIEKLLRAKKVPYVSIVPAGTEKRTKQGVSEEDQRIYKEWRKGKETEFETWLTRFKPLPASARQEFADRTTILNIMATADLMLRQGMSDKEVLNSIRQFPFSGELSIDGVFHIRDGYGIEFTANRKKGYAYFASNSRQLEIPGGPAPIVKGDAEGRYYAIYGGGGGKKPPIPPTASVGGAGSIPPDRFERDYLVAIDDQKRDQPQRVTIRFTVENGAVVRRVDDGPQAALNVTPSQITDLRRRFENAKRGPEIVFAAQKLADALLVDLDKQFPRGRKELVQISQDDLLGKISLPLVQELAANQDASRLSSIDKTEVYVIRWEETRNDLASKLGSRIQHAELDRKTRDKKIRARDIVSKETKVVTLKEMVSRQLSQPENARLMPLVKTLSEATYAR